MKNLGKFRFSMMLVAFSMAIGAWASDGSGSHTYFNGVVTDALQTPLKGVRVYSVSRDYYTKTDKKGRFGLTDVRPTDTLYLEYHKTVYAVPVQGRRGVRVIMGDQLKPQVSDANELADIGYGYVRRREKVVASNGIPGEVLVRTGKTNVLDALAGLVPGLVITPDNAPGGTPTVRIRGASSIMLDCTPLYLIDGVITQSLDFVSLYDIESVEVLKDASIYGVRGASGAILVHTKRGSSK